MVQHHDCCWCSLVSELLCRWEAAGGRPGVRALYLSLMDALTAVNPTSLFFIQALRPFLCGSTLGHSHDLHAISHSLAAMEPILLCITQAGAGCPCLVYCGKLSLSSEPNAAETWLMCLIHVLLLAKNLPYVLQGCGQQALTNIGGDGFATDATIISSKNLSDPTTFFKTLLLRPYLRQVLNMIESIQVSTWCLLHSQGRTRGVKSSSFTRPDRSVYDRWS